MTLSRLAYALLLAIVVYNIVAGFYALLYQIPRDHARCDQYWRTGVECPFSR